MCQETPEETRRRQKTSRNGAEAPQVREASIVGVDVSTRLVVEIVFCRTLVVTLRSSQEALM